MLTLLVFAWYVLDPKPAQAAGTRGAKDGEGRVKRSLQTVLCSSLGRGRSTTGTGRTWRSPRSWGTAVWGSCCRSSEAHSCSGQIDWVIQGNTVIL